MNSATRRARHAAPESSVIRGPSRCPVSMFICRLSRVLSIVFAGVWLSACGGGGGSDPPPNISVAFAQSLPAQLSLTDVLTVAAVVSNDPADRGVTWTVTCDSASCGSFNPIPTPSGQTTSYTPPQAIPSPATVTLTATSVADSSRSVSGTVTLTAAAGAVLADGTYVYHLSGFDSNGPFFLAGAFTVQAGQITGGEQDFSDASGGFSDSLVPAQCGLYIAGANIQVVLGTGDTNVGVNGIETLRGTSVSGARALLSEFDGSATASGSLDLQTSVATPAGGYAFGLQGNSTGTGGSSNKPLVIGGIWVFNGGSLSVNDSVFDLNNGPANGSLILQDQAFASGSVTAPDSFGRVTIELTPSSASGIPEMKFSAFIVSPARMYLIEDQADVLNANLGGVALGQGVNTGTFSMAHVAGTSYAHGSAGVDAANGALTLAGGFAFNADGTVGGKLALADSANHNGNVISGSYTVDPTGRVSLTGVYLGTNGLTLDFQLYLDGNGNGIVMGIDSFQTTEGLAYSQVATQPLAGPLALSVQGLLPNGNPWSAVGMVTLSSGSFSGATDFNNDGVLLSAVGLSGAVSSNGTFQFTGLKATDFSESTGWGYYPIDNSRTLAIEIDGQALGLLLLEGITN